MEDGVEAEVQVTRVAGVEDRVEAEVEDGL